MRKLPQKISESPSPKVRRKSAHPVAALCQRRPVAVRKDRRSQTAATINLPTQLERDTLLTPEWVAENVVQEAERFLKADLPANFVERLAAKAHHLYPRHKQFHKMLNRPGNAGRDNLFMYMRHWTAAWLKRERYALHKKLPWSYSLGRRLPVTTTNAPKNYPDATKLVAENWIRPN